MASNHQLSISMITSLCFNKSTKHSSNSLSMRTITPRTLLHCKCLNSYITSMSKHNGRKNQDKKQKPNRVIMGNKLQYQDLRYHLPADETCGRSSFRDVLFSIILFCFIISFGERWKWQKWGNSKDSLIMSSLDLFLPPSLQINKILQQNEHQFALPLTWPEPICIMLLWEGNDNTNRKCTYLHRRKPKAFANVVD